MVDYIDFGLTLLVGVALGIFIFGMFIQPTFGNFNEGFCEAKNMTYFEADYDNDTFTCISDLGTTKTFLKQKINKTFKVIEVK